MQKNQRVKIGQIEICFSLFGESTNQKTVLMLHGWGANKELFDASAAELSQRSSCRVYTIDLPGFGASSPPTSVWGSDDYAEVVTKFIKKLDLGELDLLLGHSHGGRVSIKLATSSPELVKKMVLLNSAGLRPHRSLKYHFKVRLFKLAKFVVLKLIPGEARKKLLMDHLYGRFGSSDYRDSGELRKTFVKVVNEDLSPLLPQIRQPTLLMWGDKDQETPLWMAKQMDKAIPDSGLVVIKGAGHYSFLDSHAQFCAVLSNFLDG